MADDFKTITQMQTDSTSGTPLESDFNWIRENAIIPNYQHQPNIIYELGIPITPIDLHGPEFSVAPIFGDVGDPVYDFEIVESNTNFLATTDYAYHPILQMSHELSENQMRLPVANRDRLLVFMKKAVKKFKQWENRYGFQGGLKYEGFIGSDSYDLENPTANWGIVNADNGYLNNMLADIRKVVKRFMNQGFYNVPINLCVDGPIYELMKNSLLVKKDGNNLDLVMKMLPPGSRVHVSNDINSNYNTSAPADPSTNSQMCAILQAPMDWVDGLNIFSSGIRQAYYPMPVYKHLWHIAEKFSVKVRDNKLVCWMDGINLSTS